MKVNFNQASYDPNFCGKITIKKLPAGELREFHLPKIFDNDLFSHASNFTGSNYLSKRIGSDVVPAMYVKSYLDSLKEAVKDKFVNKLECPEVRGYFNYNLDNENKRYYLNFKNFWEITHTL